MFERFVVAKITYPAHDLGKARRIFGEHVRPFAHE